jgi:hypothetical protein
MLNTNAATPEEYLDDLPPDRREIVSTLRDLVLRNLPPGYEEAIRWGMLSYEVPLSRYPKTYNKEPLLYLALAAQKHHFSLYLLGIYSQEDGEEKLRAEFQKAGMKLDMGKSCVRFRRIEDLPLDVLAKTVAATSVEDFIALYEESRRKGKR